MITKAFAGVLAAALALLGCSPGSLPHPQKAHHPAPIVSPFTGERVKALEPVIAVKIDNLAAARPQTGIQDADIVYVEPVEGGLSRFIAVFSSRYPHVIGPVWSARAEDIPLLRQFGKPALAYSGAVSNLIPVLAHSRIVNLYDAIAGGYFRDSNRFAPHNLYAIAKTLRVEGKSASLAHDIGFRFGAKVAGGKGVRAVTYNYPSAYYRFTWSGRRWIVWIDGVRATTTDGGQLSIPTVVIQHVRERMLGPSPFAVTVGRGKAEVLRDGRSYETTWSRATTGRGTSFTLANGKRMTFARGPVWIVLAR